MAKTTWEYVEIPWSSWERGGSNFVRWLNIHGEKGWELVDVFAVGSSHGITSNCLFKRALSAPPKPNRRAKRTRRK